MLNINETETTISYKRWLRARLALLDYPFGGLPSIEWHREWLQQYADGATTQDNAGILRVAYDPAGTFPLVNPETGENLGTGTDQQLLVLLYSKFLYDQGQDDLRTAPAEPEPSAPAAPGPSEEGAS